MNLRTSRRQPLAETSFNPRTSKRKAASAIIDDNVNSKKPKTMKGTELSNPPASPQRLPSPRRSKTVPGPADTVLFTDRQVPNVLSSAPSLPPPESSRSGASTKRSKSQSPTRSPTRSGKSVSQPKSLDSIAITDLEECHPKIKMRPYSWVVAKTNNKVPQPVVLLHKRLEKVSKVFPSELKETFKIDSKDPLKPGPAPTSNEYMIPNGNPLPVTRLPRLKELLDHLIYISEQNYRLSVYEREWGVIVSNLLGEFELWNSRRVRVLNVEDSMIEPVELRIRTQDGPPLIADEQSSQVGSTVSDSLGRPISRMVDWSVAIDLDEKDADTIHDGNIALPEGLRSLNQSKSSIKFYPIFLDIELKRTFSDRDPKVQLAIWACGALLKKRWHGWSTKLPMPGITVTGPNWDYFLFFEIEGDLIMIGPYYMGSTKDLRGIWQIANRLQILIEWGKKEYREWFDDTVLKDFETMAKARAG
ncbi:MAG: hypothetical protein Q9166_000667 [cf. Caloplaca sp. 2 TL-2023]